MKLLTNLNGYADNKKRLIAMLMIFTGAVFFSGKAILIKMAYQEGVSPSTLLNLRMLFSLPLFLVSAWISSKKHVSNLSKSDLQKIFMFSIIGYYLSSYLDFSGLRYITASFERFIIFSYPTMVVVISAILSKKRLSKEEILALILTYIGIGIIFLTQEDVFSRQSTIGVIMVFFSAFTYAIFLIGSGHLIPRIGAVRFTSYAMIISTMAVAVHNHIVQETVFDLAPRVYLISVSLAFFCTFIPAITLAKGIALVGPGTASIVSTIGPVITLALANIILDEGIGIFQLAGGILVMMGVLTIVINKDTDQIKTINDVSTLERGPKV